MLIIFQNSFNSYGLLYCKSRANITVGSLLNKHSGPASPPRLYAEDHLLKLGCYLVTQLCPTLFDPMDCHPPGFSVHGISQARILEWVAIFHLQGIFPTQGLNPHLLFWQAGSLPLSTNLGSPYLSFLHLNFPTCEMGDMGFSGGTSGKEPTC